MRQDGVGKVSPIILCFPESKQPTNLALAEPHRRLESKKTTQQKTPAQYLLPTAAFTVHLLLKYCIEKIEAKLVKNLSNMGKKKVLRRFFRCIHTEGILQYCMYMSADVTCEVM